MQDFSSLGVCISKCYANSVKFMQLHDCNKSSELNITNTSSDLVRFFTQLHVSLLAASLFYPVSEDDQD